VNRKISALLVARAMSDPPAWLGFGSSAPTASRASSRPRRTRSQRDVDRDVVGPESSSISESLHDLNISPSGRVPSRVPSSPFVRRDGLERSSSLPASTTASSQPPRPPRRIARQKSNKSVAEEFGECAVCFEALCSAPTAVFVASERHRVCAHFFHVECAGELAKHDKKCPTCRASFARVLPVPSPRENPNGWFAACDVDGDGRLSKAEVLEVLRAQLKCDWRAIERELPTLWPQWDVNGDGYVERHEMMKRGGLLDYVSKSFAKAKSVDAGGGRGGGGGSGFVFGDVGVGVGVGGGVGVGAAAREERQKRAEAAHHSTSGSHGIHRDDDRRRRHRKREVPSIVNDPTAWFAFWDFDDSGALDKEEVVRALIKTFKLGRDDVRKAQDMRAVVNATWGLFDPDGSGSVDRREFLMRDGLAETIVASATSGGLAQRHGSRSRSRPQ